MHMRVMVLGAGVIGTTCAYYLAKAGHDVVVVEDCCASYPDEWHRFSVDNIMPLLATVTSSGAVLAALRAG